MPAQEVAPRPVQLGNAPPASDPVHHAGTDEIRSRPTEAASDADDADSLVHILPFPTADACRDS